MNYTHPRKFATFIDWPYGTERTTAVFKIETHPKRGERATRATLNPKTQCYGAPKALTYSVKQRIVDGDDGKTYILCLTMYGSISVMQSNMQYSQEHIDASDPRHATLRDYFYDVN